MVVRHCPPGLTTPSARDAEYGVGALIDLARAMPVAKHRRVVVVIAVGEFARVKAVAERRTLPFDHTRPVADGTTQ